MKSPTSKLLAKLRQLSPLAVFVAGLVYTLALGLLDYATPVGMSFTLFYVLATAFVGWGAGRWPAVLLALMAATLVVSHDWTIPAIGTQPTWVMAWNISTRFLVLCAAGWLSAELSRLTGQLARLVEQRTVQWKTEAEQHKATSARLAESLDLNQRILAASAMGIAAYKASGECVFANEAIARIAGGTVAEIMRGNFRQLESWKQSGLLELAEGALAQGRALSAECCDTSRFGKTVWIDAHMTPFMSNGQPHLLHLSYDITERQRLERQVLEISDHEQARIGQELHDGLCQQLVSLAFDANSLEQQLTQARRPEVSTAHRVAEFLDRAITEARQLSRGLFPVRLEAEGLSSALEELANSTSERFGLNCRFAANEPGAVKSKPMATHLYRIAQEAVNNSVRHGKAKRIEIRLQSRGEQLELRIEDDGTGAEVETLAPGKLTGMGLYIMNYRARSIGGTLRLGRSRSGGTTVSCCVSLAGG